MAEITTSYFSAVRDQTVYRILLLLAETHPRGSNGPHLRTRIIPRRMGAEEEEPGQLISHFSFISAFSSSRSFKTSCGQIFHIASPLRSRLRKMWPCRRRASSRSGVGYPTKAAPSPSPRTHFQNNAYERPLILYEMDPPWIHLHPIDGQLP
jgi:hypothetical protein